MKCDGIFLRVLKSKKDGRHWAVFILDGSDGLPDVQPVWVLLTEEDVDFLQGVQPFDQIPLNAVIRGRSVSYTIRREK